jgi:hypothetical protein
MISSVDFVAKAVTGLSAIGGQWRRAGSAIGVRVAASISPSLRAPE